MIVRGMDTAGRPDRLLKLRWGVFTGHDVPASFSSYRKQARPDRTRAKWADLQFTYSSGFEPQHVSRAVTNESEIASGGKATGTAAHEVPTSRPVASESVACSLTLRQIHQDPYRRCPVPTSLEAVTNTNCNEKPPATRDNLRCGDIGVDEMGNVTVVAYLVPCRTLDLRGRRPCSHHQGPAHPLGLCRLYIDIPN